MYFPRIQGLESSWTTLTILSSLFEFPNFNCAFALHLPWSFHVRAHFSCVIRSSNCSPSYLLCPAFDFLGLLDSPWSLLFQTEEFYVFNPTPFGSCSVTLSLVILWVIYSSSLFLSDEGSSTSPSAQAVSAIWDIMKQYSHVFLFLFFSPQYLLVVCFLLTTVEYWAGVTELSVITHYLSPQWLY